MVYEIQDCIDAGTEYCPCHLAETGDCILCSQLSGKTFCDCINWKGVCIYQEYIWNGSKAKEGRSTYVCKVEKKTEMEKNLIVFSLSVPHALAKNLTRVGSFVFLRHPKSMVYYNAPMSVMDIDIDENILKIAIELKGIKTKMINTLAEGEKILIKGPFWNGDLGIKNIEKSKEGVSLLIARGIGQATMIPVLKNLSVAGNKSIVILDKANYKDVFINEYLELYNSTVIYCNTLKDGELSEKLKETVDNIIKDENLNLIYCAGPDILNFKVLEHIDDRVDFSCCNNAKMCCGEGVCGVCTTRFGGHKLKRLCKSQIDPKYLFAGRRLI